MKKFISILLSCLFVSIMFSQTTLNGKVTDEFGDILLGANVVLHQDGALITGVPTDFDGNYSINVDPGIYDIEISYIGYPAHLKKNIVIKENTENIYDAIMEGQIEIIWCGGTMIYKVPVYKTDDTNNINTITAEQISHAPIKKVKEFVGMVPGVSIWF